MCDQFGARMPAYHVPSLVLSGLISIDRVAAASATVMFAGEDEFKLAREYSRPNNRKEIELEKTVKKLFR